MQEQFVSHSLTECGVDLCCQLPDSLCVMLSVEFKIHGTHIQGYSSYTHILVPSDMQVLVSPWPRRLAATDSY